MAKSPAWTRKEGKDPKGGLNAKGRASAKAQGMNLKPPGPVTRNPTCVSSPTILTPASRPLSSPA